MKYFRILVPFFLIQAVNAQTITVRDVKAFVSADSAAAAREQALNQAHQLAFQKLVNENFPESTASLPSQDILREMVNNFSIDREKTTLTSYTASLTFQFDEPLLLNWIQQGQHSQKNSFAEPFAHQAESSSIKIIASYLTHLEWQHIRQTLENFPGVQSLSIFTLSPKNANMKIVYRGPIDKLQKGLLQRNIFLTQQKDGWALTSNEQKSP